ncbi:TPA: glycosyltransferase [Serratia odorifera]|nr:glycosyltransferase [Serratia odorifera]
MNKILIVTPRFPYPVIGGDRLRIFNICKELAKKYELILVSLCETQSELNYPVPQDGVFSEVHRVMLPTWKSRLNTLLTMANVFKRTPLQIAYYRSDEFQQLVNSKARECQLLLAHLVRTSEYIVNLPQPKVVEMTGAISMNYERVRQVAGKAGLKNCIYSLEQHRLNCYERQLIEKIDLAVFVSKVDKEYLYKNNYDDKVLVCSNGVDMSSYTNSEKNDSKRLVFIGNMNSVQNMDAALWFASKVMPVLRQHGDYTFVVIGRIQESSIKSLLQYPGVVVTGEIEDIGHYTVPALAGICSVRLGAGVQNKVLEYMAHGIPAIVSSVGYEGIHAQPDRDLIIAESVDDYVQAVLKLNSDQDYYQRISVNGKDFIARNQSWAMQLQPFVEQIDKLIEG